MSVNGQPIAIQDLLARIIGQVGADLERTRDPMKQAALQQAAFRLTEGLWWINASQHAGNLVQMP